MVVTVVGAGNAGLIHAAKLIEQGHEVSILKTSSAGAISYFDKIKRDGCYTVVDAYPGGGNRRYVVRPARMTRDVAQALRGAEMIFVMTTVTQHEFVAQTIAPYLCAGQYVVICPSYMSIFLFKRYISVDVTYCEWETTAYNGRVVNDEYVKISFYNPRNASSVTPKARGDEAIKRLAECFGNTRYLRTNTLETALHNPNMIVHTVGVVLSASRIECSKGEFWMYREAFSSSVYNVIRQFDEEKNRILETLGMQRLDYFEAAKWRNEEDLSKDALEVFRSFANLSNKGPSRLEHRYLLEDVPMGLVLFSSIGDLLAVKTTIADAIITLASALLSKSFREDGRTIQKLLDRPDLTKEQLYALLQC